MPLELYQLVRIRTLHHPLEHYDGWGVNVRPPQVGDIGTLIDILTGPGLPTDYIVELSGPDGISIWLGDFSEDEIEAVSPTA
jgi:hypothetical protein